MEFFQIKVTLKHTKPPIWRRLIIAPEIKLDRLHDVLQIAMGWTNSHLYQFETPDGYFADPSFEREETQSSKKATLKSVLGGPRSHIRYEYDFGDGWDHQILLEKVVELDQPALAFCLGGARSSPPEDCGGPWGYANLLATLKDPKSAEHDSMIEWVGAEFDPDAFDVEAINKQLARLAPPRPTKPAQKKAAARGSAARGARQPRLPGVKSDLDLLR
jgi:Plasmid pRiA4b ORF-3-like protein